MLATDTHRLRGENPAPPAPLLRGPPCFPGADAGALPSLSGVGREFPRARRGCRTRPFLLEKVFSPRLWQNSPTEGQVDTRPQVLAALSSVIWREKSNRRHRLCGPSLSRSVYDEVSKMPPRLARRGRHARAAPGGLPSSLTAPVMLSDARRTCREVTACSSCWRGWDCRCARHACAARLAGIGELAGPSSQPPQPGSSRTGDWCGSGRRAACGGAGPAVLHGELLAPGPLSGSGRRPVSFPPNASGAQHKVC